MDTISMVFIGLAALSLVITLMSIKVVPEGMEYTVERFGKYTRTLRPGLSFIVPFADSIGNKMHTQ